MASTPTGFSRSLEDMTILDAGLKPITASTSFNQDDPHLHIRASTGVTSPFVQVSFDGETPLITSNNSKNADNMLFSQTNHPHQAAAFPNQQPIATSGVDCSVQNELFNQVAPITHERSRVPDTSTILTGKELEVDPVQTKPIIDAVRASALPDPTDAKKEEERAKLAAWKKKMELKRKHVQPASKLPLDTKAETPSVVGTVDSIKNTKPVTSTTTTTALDETAAGSASSQAPQNEKSKLEEWKRKMAEKRAKQDSSVLRAHAGLVGGDEGANRSASEPPISKDKEADEKAKLEGWKKKMERNV